MKFLLLRTVDGDRQKTEDKDGSYRCFPSSLPPLIKTKRPMPWTKCANGPDAGSMVALYSICELGKAFESIRIAASAGKFKFINVSFVKAFAQLIACFFSVLSVLSVVMIPCG
jgi:hypothetical protein